MSLSLGTIPAYRLRAFSLPGLWRAARNALKRAERRAAIRREVARMDDHMLSDIGVSRAQLCFLVDHED
jgi:uncharacterized protein YjiS (DUF1127 family)